MTEPFVIDGVCHPYNLTRANLQGRFGELFNEALSPGPVSVDSMRVKLAWSPPWTPGQMRASARDRLIRAERRMSAAGAPHSPVLTMRSIRVR